MGKFGIVGRAAGKGKRAGAKVDRGAKAVGRGAKRAPGAAKRGAKAVRSTKATTTKGRTASGAKVKGKTRNIGPYRTTKTVKAKKGKTKVESAKYEKQHPDFRGSVRATGASSKRKTKSGVRIKSSSVKSVGRGTITGEKMSAGIVGNVSRARKGRTTVKTTRGAASIKGGGMNIKGSGIEKTTRKWGSGAVTKIKTQSTNVNGQKPRVTSVKTKRRSYKPSMKSSRTVKSGTATNSVRRKTTSPISARNAAIGAGATGGYITYKRRTPSGKTITVRRRRSAK